MHINSLQTKKSNRIKLNIIKAIYTIQKVKEGTNMKHFAALASILIYFFIIIGVFYYFITFPLTTFLAIHILALLIAIYGLNGAKILSSIAIGLHAIGIIYIIMLLNGM